MPYTTTSFVEYKAFGLRGLDEETHLEQNYRFESINPTSFSSD